MTTATAETMTYPVANCFRFAKIEHGGTSIMRWENAQENPGEKRNNEPPATSGIAEPTPNAFLLKTGYEKFSPVGFYV